MEGTKIENSEVMLELDDNIAILRLGQPDERFVTLTESRMVALENAIKTVASNTVIAGLIITGAGPGIFCAGADVNAIRDVTSETDAKRLAHQGQTVFNRIAALRIPTVVAINGACAGGGFELSLACDFRIAADIPEVKIGLPEVKLGILPGFGGTQRLPRLIGLPAALDVMLKGRLAPTELAKSIGLVDYVVSEPTATDKCFSALIRDAKEIINGRISVSKPNISVRDKMLTFTALGRKLVCSQALASVKKSTGGHYPAPLKIPEVAAYGLKNGITAGLQNEAAALAELLVTRVSKSLIHIYFLTEECTKRWKSLKNSFDNTSAAVIGAGVMGAGIASSLLQAGLKVILVDRDPAAQQKGKERIKASLEKRYKRAPEQASKTLEKLRLTGDSAETKNATIIVEAIVENLEVKNGLFKDLSSTVDDKAILATNTSSLPISEIASGVRGESRVIGMHFFNPVEKMPLVEIVCSPRTDERTIALTSALAAKMGKYPVVVEQVPGFLVNRILTPYLIEAAWTLHDGYRVEDIDSAAVKFGMPMGPIRLLDEIGLDVAAHVSEILQHSYGERMEGPTYASKLVQSGRLGRKSGLGFYKFDGRDCSVDENVYAALEIVPSRDVDELEFQKLTDRLILSMVNEAVRCLDEGVAGAPGRDAAGQIDLATVMGTGFAPFRGGIIHYAESCGAKDIANRLDALSGELNGRLAPADGIKARAALDVSFYEALKG